ncbi:ABC transporter permease [uncultured Friedmanniella sp.]|uniref:ABC transporter permease n=1 Tax=uncultured Friedmanniella sp. TaxID=335381 RepID=UPI0035CB1796
MTTTAVKQAAADSQPKVVARPPARRGDRLKTYGPPLLAFGVILVVWYALAGYLAAQGRTTILPNPTRIIVDSFAPADPRDTPITADLLSSLALSTGVALTGLAISIVIGIVWAVLMSQARWVERSLFPYAVMLQCVPILALVPLIGSSLGYSLESRVLVCVLISLFPMVSNTLFGLQAADRSSRELFQLQGASRWTVLTKLQFPGAMPAIFAGMRISAGLAVIGAIVGDFFFRRGQAGLGVLINNYASRLQTAELWAAVLTASLLGVVIFLVFGWIGKLAVGRWYEPSA